MITNPFPTPALDTWHAELAAGTRSESVYDALWRAAGWEQSALEAHAAGATEAALNHRQVAAGILSAAAEEQS